MTKVLLLSMKQAAEVLGVSHRHIQRLLEEADVDPRGSRWKHGREIITLSTKTALRRTIRINVAAVLPNLDSEELKQLDRADRAKRSKHSVPAEPTAEDLGPGYVYLLKHELSGCYKIGRTICVNNRMRQLKLGKHTKLLDSVFVPDPVDHELRLHQRFAEYRLPQSEWFCLGEQPSLT